MIAPRFRLLRSTRVWGGLLLLLCIFGQAECVLPSESFPLSPASASGHLHVGAPSGLDPAPFSLLDVWAGISAFADGFSHQSACRLVEHAWIEWCPVAQGLLRRLYPTKQACSDFFSYQWRPWQFLADLVVTSGPSCCPFSMSGKRLGAVDPRSSQGMETAMLAVHLAALVLVMENVCDLVDGDHRHKVLSSINDYLQQNGYVLSGILRLKDCEIGGFSQRERVFLIWELAVMCASLPRMCETLPAQAHRPCLLDILDPYSEVESLAVRGVFHPSPPARSSHDQQLRSSEPTVAGFILIQGSGSWTLGEGVKFPSSRRIWRVIQLTDTHVRLLFEAPSRRNSEFQWFSRERLKLSFRRSMRWTVYSLLGVARAVRHTSFAPGDLYLDERGPAICRPLSGHEMWRVQGLPAEKAALLAPEELGPLAGNSIPASMTSLVAGRVASRVALFAKVKARQAAGCFTCLNAPPRLAPGQSPSALPNPSASKRPAPTVLSAVCLLLVCVADNTVSVWDGDSIPWLVGDFTQEQAFTKACAYASELGAVSARDTSVLLEVGARDQRLRAAVAYSHVKIQSPLFQYRKPSSLGDSELGALMAHAVTQVQRMVGTVGVSPASEVWCSGRVHGRAAWQAEPTPADGPAETDFHTLVQQHSSRQAELDILLARDGSPEMEAWRSRLTPVDLADIPDPLRHPLRPAASGWSDLLFQDPHAAIETVWAALPVQPSLSKRPAPQGWLSGIRRPFRLHAASLVDAFQCKLTKWMQGKAERPVPVVIPGLWLKHWLFECPHDFKSDPGFAVPIRLDKPLPTHLNLQFFEEWGSDYPDQELISHLILGVRYKADLPVQIVLQPHLQSFIPVQGKFLKEADRFLERGWSDVADSLWILPAFFHACGSTCRKLEPERPRMTTDAGAPRTELWDTDGVRVVPLNEAIEAASAWPKEVKPRALMQVLAIAILQEAAAILGETIFIMTDDYASFFNQLRLAPSEIPKTGVMHPPRGTAKARFGHDKVLGFGIKMASNIAQRFADLMVFILKQRLQPAMTAVAATLCAKSTEFAAWWKHRQALGEGQALLFSVLCYTDDPCFLCLGPDMTHQVLKGWHWLTSSAGTMMAIVEKRTLGTSAYWIGIKFYAALGISVVTQQKALRAVQQISLACGGHMTLDQYRSTIGFLEHLRDVLFLRGDKMYGLYAPFGEYLQPWDRVSLSALACKQLNRWAGRLLNSPGSSVQHAAAFITGQKLPKLSAPLSFKSLNTFSDAAKEGTEYPGLGGWTCGFYWRVPLSREHLELDIPVLEGLACVVNLLTVHKLLGGTEHLSASLLVEVHVDAKATADLFIKGSARSPMMTFLHSLSLQLTEVTDLLPFLYIRHVFGLGNPASDAASRGYTGVLRAIAALLDLRLVELPPPEQALRLLDECLQHSRSLRIPPPPD